MRQFATELQAAQQVWNRGPVGKWGMASVKHRLFLLAFTAASPLRGSRRKGKSAATATAPVVGQCSQAGAAEIAPVACALNRCLELVGTQIVHLAQPNHGGVIPRSVVNGSPGLAGDLDHGHLSHRAVVAEVLAMEHDVGDVQISSA